MTGRVNEQGSPAETGLVGTEKSETKGGDLIEKALGNKKELKR